MVETNKGLQMNVDRIEELMKQTAYPESRSVMQAMLQVWNEMQQDFNSRKCENCIHNPKEGENFSDRCGTCSHFYGSSWEANAE